MKQKLPLLLMAGVLLGTTSFTIPASAENTQIAQLRLEAEPQKPRLGKTGTQPPPPGRPGKFDTGVVPKAPGKVAPAPPVFFNCAPGFTKTKQVEYGPNDSLAGGMHTMECRSPIIECPHPSKVRTDKGTVTAGHGNEIVKLPVGSADSNRIRIQYTCTYYWNLS